MADSLRPEAPTASDGRNVLLLVFSWLWVGVPLAWGILETLRTSLALMR
jgi:hypothetical protein